MTGEPFEKFPNLEEDMTENRPSQLWQQAQAGLQKFWGYDRFRPLQGEIATSLLQHRDALVMLPTGAGKSLCFQLPALLQEGLTLVVSPLVALMEDQVRALEARHGAATLLHSEQSRGQRQKTLQMLENGQVKLLYLSPESLLSVNLWQRLTPLSQRVQTLVIDEAHCIAQWGSHFRPVYRRLGTVRPGLLQHRSPTDRIAIAAFTATADAATQQDIRNVLGLKQPQVFRSSPYRKNLSLQIVRVWTPAARRDRLQQFVRARGQTTGLVYTRSRRDSEQLVEWLQQQGLRAAAYHAGLAPQLRRQIEQQWLSGELPFVICTSAFGMGVDKSNVRWVCHFHPPLTLAEYLQEIGRAGRDGVASQTLLIASEPTGLLDPTDRQRREGFLRQMRSQAQLAQTLAKQLPKEGYLPDVLKQEPQAELALAILQTQGQLVWIDPFNYRFQPKAAAMSQAEPQASVEAYLSERGCRWRFLLDAFGFGREAQGLRCGHCDRCQP
ncbi:RecQ family ATP-dependent DNA helicase [Altericista sp. CCNU0014]|uniref:RecQ family ATP-dependent DNA helicase n=1 Tax=Altericista sp. CCNU0014 TaxID=3082949 RepID=UPI00384F2801